jgi:hypothetical protein
MSEHERDDIPPEGEEDVEAHLIKETLAAGAISAALFAGSAQAAHAQLPSPGGGGTAVNINPGGGTTGGNNANPGGGNAGANNANPGGGNAGANNANPGGGNAGANNANPGGGNAGGVNVDPGGGSGAVAKKKAAPAKQHKAPVAKKKHR